MIRLPETTIVAADTAAVEMYGENADTIVGRHATSLFHGADLVHAAIALGALAAGAVDSYSVQCRSGNSTGANGWLCVRRFDVEEAQLAVAMTVPDDQQRPLDPVEQEFAAATGIGWVSTSPSPGLTLADGSAAPHDEDSAFAVSTGYPPVDRDVVAALLQAGADLRNRRLAVPE